MPSRGRLSHRRKPALPPPKMLQALHPTHRTIVTLRFSPNGKFLAVALQHGTILLYGVLPPPQSTEMTGDLDYSMIDDGAAYWTKSRAVVFPEPLRALRGHKGDVLGLSFSTSDLLASASMDHTVRLWPVHDTALPFSTTTVGLHACTPGSPSQHVQFPYTTLHHPGMATDVAFAPPGRELLHYDPEHSPPLLLMSACSDCRARVWCLADGRVVAAAQAGTVITMCAYVSARRAVVGTFDGQVLGWRVAGACVDGDGGTGREVRGTGTVDPLRVSLCDMRRIAGSAGRREGKDKGAMITSAGVAVAGVVDEGGGIVRRTVLTARGGAIVEVRDGLVTRRLRAQGCGNRKGAKQGGVGRENGNQGGNMNGGVSSGTGVCGASDDGRFVIVEASGRCVRLADMERTDVREKGRSGGVGASGGWRERGSAKLRKLKRGLGEGNVDGPDGSVATVEIEVVGTGRSVTATAVAGERVRRIGSSCLLLAVGADDGSISFVEQHFPSVYHP